MEDFKRGVKGTRYPQLRQASAVATGGYAGSYYG